MGWGDRNIVGGMSVDHEGIRIAIHDRSGQTSTPQTTATCTYMYIVLLLDTSAL